MFWDGFKLALYLIILIILLFGEFKLGGYVVTDNKPLKWFLIIVYGLGAIGIILKSI